MRPEDRIIRDSDSIWRDAEALIDRFDRQARSGNDGAFAQSLAEALRDFTSATAIAFRIRSSDSNGPNDQVTIAKTGVSLLTVHANESSAVQKSDSTWLTNDQGAAVGLVVSRQLVDPEWIQFELAFDCRLLPSRQQVILETTAALADIALPVLLRETVRSRDRSLSVLNQNQQRLENFFGGATASETYRSIARTLASSTRTDRVSLLVHRRGRCDLVATSVPSDLDPRSAQVQSLRKLVSGASTKGEAGDQDLLTEYQIGNSVDQLHVANIVDARNQLIASIVFEHYESLGDAQSSASKTFQPLKEITKRAIQAAIDREASTSQALAGSIRRLTKKNIACSFAFLLAGMVLLCFVHIPMRLTVPGHVVASSQSTIFSPAQGTVSAVHVVDGDEVATGQSLAELRSPQLDLVAQSLESELATTRAKFAALQSFRRGQNDAATSAEAEVLKTQAAGIEDQLKVVTGQQKSLILTSRHDGIVNQWDAQGSLPGRVVVIGQPLIRVIDPIAGWNIELEVPDRHAGYLINHPDESIKCDYRLRAAPTRIHLGVIDHIERSAEINASGNSIVRASVKTTEGSIGNFRHGASVVAKIDCGRHPAAFVLFRGFVEWYREQVWF